MKSADPFAVLGVTRDAPDFVIQAAYRACLKRYHPDHYSGADAAARTAEIVSAYNFLKDPKNREKPKASDRDQARSGRNEPPKSPPSPPPQTSDAPIPDPPKSGVSPLVVVIGAVILCGIALTSEEKTVDPYQTDVLPIPTETPIDTPPDILAAAQVAEEAAVAAEGSQIAGLVGQVTGLPWSEEPVSFPNIERAVHKFAAVLKASGISGARSFSEECHAKQSRTPTWSGLDYCAAFDFAANSMDGGVAGLGGNRNAYFQFESMNQAGHYQGRIVYLRLNSIRTASENALRSAMSEKPPRAPAEPAPTTAPTPTDNFFIDENGEIKLRRAD